MGDCGNGFGSIFGGNCSWILIILVLLFCCGGFGKGIGGCGGGIFGGSSIIWILILVFFLCPGFGFGGAR